MGKVGKGQVIMVVGRNGWRVIYIHGTQKEDNVCEDGCEKQEEIHTGGKKTSIIDRWMDSVEES